MHLFSSIKNIDMYTKNLLTLTIIIATSLLTGRASTRDSQLEKVRRQYAEAVLHEHNGTDTLLADFVRLVEPETEVSDQMVQELSRLYPVTAGQVEKLLATQRPDGSWADIDYADTRRSNWAPRAHAERALLLAKLYQGRTKPWSHSEAILAAYRRAVNFWAKAGIRCRNWWYNEIGMPKTLGDSYMLMADAMTADDTANAVKVLGASHISRTGQNRVWLAGVVLARAVLQNDTTLARQARDAIAGQIVLGQKEGIQPDWSFHQHGPQQQMGNYGLAFIADMSFYTRVFKGTSLAFDSKQRDILARLIDEGYRWIVWHRRMDVGSLGRQLFHNAQVDKAYKVAFAAQDMGMGGFPLAANTLTGHRHFGCSDYTIHRRPTWMTSLKMASNRVIGTEQVNEDNLMGFYLADGATFYYVRGDEYENVFPLWDWHLIPGTTTPCLPGGRMPRCGRDDDRNHTDKVWGTSVGRCGMSAMELNRLGTHAKKAWIYTDRFVLCIGAGIRSDSTATLRTCVDQRNAHGPLARLSATRFHHDRTGYIVRTGHAEATLDERTGDWRDNMGSYKPYPATGRIMQIVLRHDGTGDTRPATYAYAVMPDCTEDDTRRFDFDREVSIQRNDDRAQIVRLRCQPGITWVAAYEGGTYKIGRHAVQIDKPGVYAYDDKDGAVVN